jgi:hypothetical protein
MPLYAVILLGVIVVVQLNGISQKLNEVTQRLESNLSAIETSVRELKQVETAIAKISGEFRWYDDSTLAHSLREWLQEIPKELIEQLRWYEDSTFAHNLKSLIRETAIDVTGEIREVAAEVLNALATIENNTSRD